MGVKRVGLGCMDMGGRWWESGWEWDGTMDWEKGKEMKEWRSAIRAQFARTLSVSLSIDYYSR